nr:PREDICTED: spondin-1 isoform X1 [Anolis carolinensis]|eukprot:XP_016848425.1 PREDICTED: spondin-1 isoform X1 [Anolis carolinensis]
MRTRTGLPSGSAWWCWGWALPALAWAASFGDETSFERAAKSEGYCSRILRAQGTRREGYNEFSLRVEGDPDFYKPGNSYRVTLSAATPAYFRGFTLIALKEGKEGDKEEDHAGTFQISKELSKILRPLGERVQFLVGKWKWI